MVGNIFVISAPSGTGKTTIVKKILETVPNLALVVSYTTRDPRPHEKEGVDYTFIDKSQFEAMINSGRFIEWAKVHGKLYGTPKEGVEDTLARGSDVLLDIDTQGAARVKQKYPDAVLIFLLPPSFEELKRRLKSRGGGTEKDLEKRIGSAGEELSRRHEYDYQVVNENLDEAVGEITEIIGYYREQ